MKKFLLILGLLPFTVLSQVSMTTTGSYTQNFDGLANTGTAIPWADNSTIPSWYSQRSGTGTTYNAGDGSSNTGALYSFGTGTNTERALGSVGSGTPGNFAHGIQLRNTSGGNLSDVRVSYTMEQWRDGGNATPVAQSLRVFYQVSSSLITSLTPNVNTGWTEVTALMTTSPYYNTTATALDGNHPAYRVTLTNISIPGLLLAPNDYIMIKWEDPNNSGNDHGLAIDDVTVAWTTNCNTTHSFSVTTCNSYTVPSGDETYFADGVYMDTIPNAALCDSILTITVDITTGITYYADVDVDTYGDPNNTTTACSPPVGYVTNDDDCNDNNPFVGPATTSYYQDSDNDGYGNPAVSQIACSPPVGYVANNTDCNDGSNTIHPGATDIPDNTIDENCDGSDASAFGNQIAIYEFTQAASCPVLADTVTSQPTQVTFSNYTSNNTTCSAAANVFSNSAWNTTSTIDPTEYNQFSITANGCNSIDINRIIFTHRISASGGTPSWTLASSLDNFTTDLASGDVLTTDQIDTINLGPAFNNVTNVTFRFYITNMALSGSTWRNDNVRVIGTFGTVAPTAWFLDNDTDGYGASSPTIMACQQPVGYVANSSDCDDNNINVHPAATEICDGSNLDENCNGLADDSDPTVTGQTAWYIDMDNDTYGDASGTAILSCENQAGYVTNNLDCDDMDNTVYQTTTYYADTDNDGYGMAGTATDYCQDPGAGWSTNDDDCEDTDNTVYPNAVELCDGLDNDCDGTEDDGLTFENYYVDGDNDGYGYGSPTPYCSNPGAGYSQVGTDCNDAVSTIHPGATEILNNSIDENCDGVDGYVGIEENSNIKFQIYPNPSNGQFELIFTQDMNNATVEVCDLNGKVLKTAYIDGTTLKMDISAFSNGTYILKVITEKGAAQKRIVLQN